MKWYHIALVVALILVLRPTKSDEDIRELVDEQTNYLSGELEQLKAKVEELESEVETLKSEVDDK